MTKLILNLFPFFFFFPAGPTQAGSSTAEGLPGRGEFRACEQDGGGWGGDAVGRWGAGLWWGGAESLMWLLFVLLLLLPFIFFHCFWLNIFCVVTVCHKMVVLGWCSFLSLWAPAPQMVSVRPCPRCPKRFPPLPKIFYMRLYIFHPFRKYRLIRALPETAIYC